VRTAGGKAPHWRLTELGYMREGPTCEFDRWDKTKFNDKKTESRAGNGARGVLEMAHTSVPEMAHTKPEKRAGNGAHTAAPGVPEMAHISRLPSNCLPPTLRASHDDEGRPAGGTPGGRLAAIPGRPALAKRAPQSAVASERGAPPVGISDNLARIIRERGWSSS
jgi:hypothetical protein